MPETKCSKNTVSSLSSVDEALLQELSSDESSVFIGGFSLVNDTDRTQTFNTFGQTVPSKRSVLQPGQSGNYSGEFVTYNSSRDGYTPTQQPVDPNGAYHFYTQGNNTILGGINTY
ncbi:MAG: hypothetical protein ACK6A9_12180 [Dolichospermum sp.]|jgi:hypothetical protein